MDPEDLVVTLSPKYINNTWRDKCAQVHRIKNKAANAALAICIMLKELVEIHFQISICTPPKLLYFKVEAY